MAQVSEPKRPEYTKHWTISDAGSTVIHKALVAAFRAGQTEDTDMESALKDIEAKMIKPVIGWGVVSDKILTHMEWEAACFKTKLTNLRRDYESELRAIGCKERERVREAVLSAVNEAIKKVAT